MSKYYVYPRNVNENTINYSATLCSSMVTNTLILYFTFNKFSNNSQKYSIDSIRESLINTLEVRGIKIQDTLKNLNNILTDLVSQCLLKNTILDPKYDVNKINLFLNQTKKWSNNIDKLVELSN